MIMADILAKIEKPFALEITDEDLDCIKNTVAKNLCAREFEYEKPLNFKRDFLTYAIQEVVECNPEDNQVVYYIPFTEDTYSLGSPIVYRQSEGLKPFLENVLQEAVESTTTEVQDFKCVQTIRKNCFESFMREVVFEEKKMLPLNFTMRGTGLISYENEIIGSFDSLRITLEGHVNVEVVSLDLKDYDITNCLFEFYTYDHKINFYGNNNMETGIMGYHRTEIDLYYVKFNSVDKMFINKHANKPAEFDYIDIYSDSLMEETKKRDQVVKNIKKKNTTNMFESMFKF